MKILRKLGIYAVCLLLVCGLVPAPSFADTAIDTGRSVNLTIGNLCCSRVDYTLYKAADISAGGKIAWTGEMQALLDKNGNPISTVQNSQEDWLQVAGTLSVYAAADQAGEDALLTPIKGVKSGNSVAFSQLSTGIYLVAAGDHSSGGYRHTITPFLITLPTRLASDAPWLYSVTVNPKFSSSYEGGSEDPKVRRSVQKIWEDDDDSEGLRPSSITVQLLRDGEEYGDPVELNEGNGWKHSFGTLASGYTWQVTEVDIPNHYTMTVSQAGTTFIMTNTYDPDKITEIEDPFVPLGPPDEFPPEPTEITEITDISDERVPLANLPQTGVLWWPVAALLGAGIFMYVLGFSKNRKYEEEHGE